MYLNPFLKVEKKNDIYYFSEKYSDTQKNFLTLRSKASLDMLMRNKKLNRIIYKQIGYSFVIPESKKFFFDILEQNVLYCSDMISKYFLSRVLMIKLNNSNIKLYNYSDLNLESFKDNLEVNYGDEFCIVVIVYDKNDRNDIKKLKFSLEKGLILFFELDKKKLIGVGPFIESHYEISLNDYLDKKKIEKIVSKSEEYWNRSIGEVILDTTLSAITDYFSDYITASSPFMYRKIILNKNRIKVCESFFRS